MWKAFLGTNKYFVKNGWTKTVNIWHAVTVTNWICSQNTKSVCTTQAIKHPSTDAWNNSQLKRTLERDCTWKVKE